MDVPMISNSIKAAEVPYALQKDGTKRFMSASVLEENHWLLYSKRLDGFLCRMCVLAKNGDHLWRSRHTQVGQLVAKGFRNCRKIVGNITNNCILAHKNSKMHEDAVVFVGSKRATLLNPLRAISGRISKSAE